MGYYIRFDNDKKVDLPIELDTRERIELCENIISSNPDYFHQKIAGNNCSEVASYKVELRLEIMANYLLNSVSNSDDYPLMSDYKSKLVKNSEKMFTELEQKYDFE